MLVRSAEANIKQGRPRHQGLAGPRSDVRTPCTSGWTLSVPALLVRVIVSASETARRRRYASPVDTHPSIRRLDRRRFGDPNATHGHGQPRQRPWRPAPLSRARCLLITGHAESDGPWASLNIPHRSQHGSCCEQSACEGLVELVVTGHTAATCAVVVELYQLIHSYTAARASAWVAKVSPSTSFTLGLAQNDFLRMLGQPRFIGHRVDLRVTLDEVVATCAGIEIARRRPGRSPSERAASGHCAAALTWSRLPSERLALTNSRRTSTLNCRRLICCRRGHVISSLLRNRADHPGKQDRRCHSDDVKIAAPRTASAAVGRWRPRDQLHTRRAGSGELGAPSRPRARSLRQLT